MPLLLAVYIMKNYIAVDMGASSIRVMVGMVDGTNISLDEVYRFKNSIKDFNGSSIWDEEFIISNIISGIKKAFEKYGSIESLGIDSWGCDYALLDENKKLISPIYAYRDERTIKAMDEVHKLIPVNELYEITGIYPQSYNTIYQLYSDKLANRLDKAKYFLNIPEYIAFRLTGVIKKEYSMASTSGLIDVNTKEFSDSIIERLGLKKEIFDDIYDSGEVVGMFTDEIVNKVGGNTTVKLCLTHDTASAIYAIKEYNSPFISSGTWSLLGVVQDKAHNDEESFNIGFTNEGYYNRTCKYLRNIMGMWIVNNILDEFKISINEFIEIAKQEEYSNTFDVNDASLLKPKSMSKAVACLLGIELNEENKTKIISSSLKSLAKSYAESIANLESITKESYDSIVIVGGGANNAYLNKLTEEYSGKKVIALPIEASSIGNILSQKK